MDEAARDVRAAASQRIQQTDDAAAEKLARTKARLAEAKERIADLEATNQQERESASNNVSPYPVSLIPAVCFILSVLKPLGRGSITDTTSFAAVFGHCLRGW